MNKFAVLFVVSTIILFGFAQPPSVFALQAKMDCTSILDEWEMVNRQTGVLRHDVIPSVTIDGKNTLLFIKAEPINNDDIQLEVKLLDRKDRIMDKTKFFVELLQENKTLGQDLFYTNSGALVLDFDQDNSINQITVVAEQANLGYFHSPSDHIQVNTPVLDGTYQLKITAVGACDGLVFFFPQEAVPVFNWAFSVSDDHVRSVTALIDSNPEEVVSPLKQFRAGIPVNQIKCKEGLVLLLHPIIETPACVKPQTEQKLVQRGWYYPVPLGWPTGSQKVFLEGFKDSYKTNEPISFTLIIKSGQKCGSSEISIIDALTSQFVAGVGIDYQCNAKYLSEDSRIEIPYQGQDTPFKIDKAGSYKITVKLDGESVFERGFVVREDIK